MFAAGTTRQGNWFEIPRKFFTFDNFPKKKKNKDICFSYNIKVSVYLRNVYENIISEHARRQSFMGFRHGTRAHK